ncbi:MAG TPA: hypothetical protein VFQ22_10915 [Longimicrobiales bacterium]|nr:hypothetical protein [Longimicrobiales bacterium]
MIRRFEKMRELEGQDPELAEALALLDPAHGDPDYWRRFRAWVVQGAARELARRRLLARMTVSDVLRSWARTVVPTAVLTAAAAGLLLIRTGLLQSPQPIGVEELLISEIEGDVTLPAPSDPVTFASGVF